MVSLSVRGSTRLVRCWEIVLQASRGTFRFTEHDRELTFDGNAYSPAGGTEAGAAVNQADLAVPNTGCRGILTSDKITEKMLREGAFNGAEVTEFLVDARFPWAGRTRLTRYSVGRTEWNDSLGLFESDLVGLTERLSRKVGEIYSRSCRWNLGDTDCGVNLATWTRTASVVSVIDDATFTTGAPAGGAVTEGFFNDGLLEWTSGDNTGLSTAVKRYTLSGNVWELSIPPASPIQVGDALSAVHGCNKQPGVDIDGNTVPEGHCLNLFNNLANFGGFPYMPTNDKLYMTPSAKRNQ